MILKKMTIEQFGKIKHYDVSFRDQLTLITTPDTDDLVKAIGLATNNKNLLMNQTSKGDDEYDICCIGPAWML